MGIPEHDRYGNPVLDQDDELVYVRRSDVQRLQAKAEAYDEFRADQEAARLGITRDGDAILEDGEAGLGRERQVLGADSPGDKPLSEDPYKAARDVFDRVLFEEGRTEREALGSALNSVVNAAHRGDQRVIIPSFSSQALGGG